MKHQNHMARRYNRTLLCCALASCLTVFAPSAFAQSTAATIRGRVSVDSVPAADARVTATNVDTGLSRTVQANRDGGYSLGGLPPGTYRIDVSAGGRSSSQTATVKVGQTATLDLGVAQAGAEGVTTLGGITVTAPALVETKTSEVATYISQKQIESLPQASRNFLAYADLVPGVQFVRNEAGETQLRGGAQSANAVNVFIDGVGQKNYVLQGGISGQDASKGNPFPQLAIGEFKVISQNYKAEFDQVSSAAIVAVTRSGSNEFGGSVFWDETRTKWRTPNEFEERNHFKQETGEINYGASFGGPIVPDVAHFFLTYEKKSFDIPRDVIPGRGYHLTQTAQDQIGHFSTPFDEDLYFGKVDWAIGQDHYFEFTAKRRSETEITNVGGTIAPEHATAKENDETRLDLRYQFTHGDWLNDAHITHEDASFNPRPVNSEVGYVLTQFDQWWDPILQLGGGADFQDKGQKGWAFQDDLTFTGIEGHAFKMGLKYKSVQIDAAEQQPYNPQFYYNIDQSLDVPFTVRFGAPLTGVGNGSISSDNKQFGIYFQDDWTVNEHLVLNLGLRWDYEATPAYTDYVTPDSVLSALNGVDPRGNGTQTYAQTLALGGIDINDYISTGHNRDNFKGEWQPRVGFSYDLFGDQKHVFFGGAGRSYDRNLFDWLQLENTKATFPTYQFEFNSATHTCTVGVNNCYNWDANFLDPATLYALASSTGAGREIDMLNNDLKTPYSDQYSFGMRNLFDLLGNQWSSSITLSHIESHDGFAFLLGNRRPDGSFFATGTTWGPPWDFGVPGYGSLIIGTNGIETRSNALLVSLEKPYTPTSGWGATVAYTYTDAKENRQSGEHYALDYPTLDQYGWRKAGGVAPHRLVATGIYDAAGGFTLSAKLTLAKHMPRYGTNCLAAWTDCKVDQYTPDGTYGEKRFDFAVEKVWGLGGDVKLRTRADLFNVFNWTNYTGYDDWWGAPGEPNPNFGKPNGASYKSRELKVTLGLNW
jgi:outer membrane receptor protein involved in Fe transport